MLNSSSVVIYIYKQEMYVQCWLIFCSPFFHKFTIVSGEAGLVINPQFVCIPSFPAISPLSSLSAIHQIP